MSAVRNTPKARKAGLTGLAALAAAASSFTGLMAAPAHADTSTIAATANAELYNGPCAHGGYVAGNHQSDSCDGAGGQAESWCADFAGWVWEHSGVAHTRDLSSGAASFYDYGRRYGTLHSYPQVGDAIVYDFNSSTDWASHVNLVTAVGDGYISVVGGNQGGGEGSVTGYNITGSVRTGTVVGPKKISGFVSPVLSATTNPSALPTGTLVKSAAGAAVKVIVNGAGLPIAGSDVSPDHYDLSRIVVVDDAAFNTLPAVPPSGTVVMDQSGGDPARYVIVDGTALHIGASDWTESGYDTRALMGVPTSWLNAAQQGTLASGLVVMDQSGKDPGRYVMVSGAALHISASEWTADSYDIRALMGVPGEWLRAAAAKTPPTGTVLMDQAENSAGRYVMVNGAAAHIEAGEWAADGYNTWPLMGAPGEWLNAAAGRPATDGTLVKGQGGASASVYVTVNGSALPVTAAEYSGVWNNGPVAGAPEQWLAASVAKPLANGTVIKNASGADSSVYVMAGGMAVPLGGADYSGLGYDKQPLRGVPGAWEAAAVAKAAPADGTMLLSPDSVTVWMVVNGGSKRAMTAAEFGTGGHSFSEVVAVPTALTAKLPTVQ
ncbi:CHAP domain-containing protein [Kitasatospora sp. CMC57]|uniref:Peptidase C51 domain-containing protein n=1 Tax=Kitasatospora sp. CMC57 TaxID=3231513 RepID=A0AB33JS74_9ACTN